MAIQTKHIVDFDDGKCSWQALYDDVLLRITRVQCTNNGAYATRGTVTVTANGRTFTRLVAAAGFLDQAVPGAAQNRLDISIDERGRIDGIDWHFEYGPNVT